MKVLLALAACVVVFTNARAQTLAGSFALQGYAPKAEGHLTATAVPGKPLRRQLDFWMTEPGSVAPIKTYQVEMTKALHVIIVCADFHTFLHVHPALGLNGHLVLKQDFPAPGTYLIYADGLPKDLNHQVFRYELTIGAKSPAQRSLQPTGMGVKVGPYEVDLSTVRLHTGSTTIMDVEILKDGKPATDLHPYLGVPAHAVFLNAQDLTYVHVHPMGMDQMNMDMSKDPPPLPENSISPAEMMLHVAVREAGPYKLWLQFRGGTELYVAEFTVNGI